MPDTGRIFIVVPSIAISWISTKPATGEATDTSRPPVADVICMNAALDFCCATVLRTHGSLTVVWARHTDETSAVQAAMARARRVFIAKRREWNVKLDIIGEPSTTGRGGARR